MPFCGIVFPQESEITLIRVDLYGVWIIEHFAHFQLSSKIICFCELFYFDVDKTLKTEMGQGRVVKPKIEMLINHPIIV